VIGVVDPQDGVQFADLSRADLLVDGYYFGDRRGNAGDDPVGRLIPVGNQGGFRFRGSPRTDTVRIAALFSTGRDPDWPDSLDELSGLFTYYGDNKSPGRELHATERGGNILLRDAFARCYGSPADRAKVPPFLLFTNTGTYRDVRFRGLLAPGSSASNSDDDLQAIWRTKAGLRFQNYRARFTVLDVPVVSRAWIDEVLAGDIAGPDCPVPWRAWVEGRAYHALIAKPTSIVRSREAQTPADPVGREILSAVYTWFAARPHDFEACAVELWRMIAPATGPVEITPPSRDRGRDAIGQYLLGPAPDRVGLDSHWRPSVTGRAVPLVCVRSHALSPASAIACLVSSLPPATSITRRTKKFGRTSTRSCCSVDATSWRSCAATGTPAWPRCATGLPIGFR
jgi:hypothetical protein